MNEKNKPDEVAELIDQFQRLGMRELHVRYDDVELYLSNDPGESGIFSRDARSTAATPGSAPGAGMGDDAAATHTAHAPPAGAQPPAGAHPPGGAHPPAAAAAKAWPPGAIVVRAPYLGTFYRAPKPGSPAYVDLGDTVKPESELCIVEVMKLFTAIRAGIAGTVHAILAQDGQLVEANQPLFVVIPGG